MPRVSALPPAQTLAYQLAQRLPLLRNYYASLDLGQIQQLHQASTAFRLLLLKPLSTLLPRDEQVRAAAAAGPAAPSTATRAPRGAAVTIQNPLGRALW